MNAKSAFETLPVLALETIEEDEKAAELFGSDVEGTE